MLSGLFTDEQTGKTMALIELTEYDRDRLIRIIKTNGLTIQTNYSRALYDYYLKYGPWFGESSGGLNERYTRETIFSNRQVERRD